MDHSSREIDSQTSIEMVLEELLYCSHEARQHEIKHLVPQLISSLEKCQKQPAQAVKFVCALFKQCLPNIQSYDVAESLIFDAALPAVHNILSETLQGISSKVQHDAKCTELIEVINSLLQVSLSLLENLEHCLDFVKSCKQLEVYKIQKFVAKLVPIVIDLLQHCFESQSIYGSYLDDVSVILGAFFQKTNDLLLKILDIIKDNIVFDCSIADQMNMLCKVLGYLCQIGKLAPCLGVRSTSETWKLFANLTTRYTTDLQGNLLLKEPLSILTAEVLRILQSVSEEGLEDKAIERNLKVASFLLRIIIMLCEQYASHLEECHSDLLELLLALYRFSELGFELCGQRTPSPLIDRILIVGADPLLALLLCAKEFHKELIISKKKDEPEAWLLLLHAIIKQLVTLTPAVRKLWLNAEGSSNIFFILSSTVGQCQENLYIKLPTSTSDFYRTVLTDCAALVAVLSVEEVEALESVLNFSIAEYQLSVLQCIFLSNLWTIVVRLSGQTFCQTHLTYLSKIYEKLPAGKKKTIIAKLILRLLSVLPAKFRSNTNTVTILQQGKALTHEDINSAVSALNSFIHDPPSVLSYKKVIDVLSTLSHTSQNLQPCTSLLPQLWAFVDNSQLGVLLGSKLFSVTSGFVTRLSNKQLWSIIGNFHCFTNQSLKLQCLNFLSDLSKLNFLKDDNQQDVFESISTAYSCLLQDSDNVVQLAALKSFDEFAHVTTHEIIVSQTVSGSKGLQNLVSEYLQSKSDYSNLQHFWCFFVGVTFALNTEDNEYPSTKGSDGILKRVDNERVSDESNAMPDTAILNTIERGVFYEHNEVNGVKLNSNSTNLIQQLNSIADELTTLKQQSLLSSDDLMQVKEVVRKLNDIYRPIFT